MYIMLTGRAWIPAFAGMTRSGNRQSINRIGIKGSRLEEYADPRFHGDKFTPAKAGVFILIPCCTAIFARVGSTKVTSWI